MQLHRFVIGLTFASLALVGCEPLDGGGGGGIGGQLAFIRNGALVISADDGSGERTLTDINTSSSPALSPTGGTIAFAFSSAGDLTRGIYTIVTAGSTVLEPIATPSSTATFSSPAWSPDGTQLVFVSTDNARSTLYTVSSTGGETPAALAPSLVGARYPAYLDSSTLVVVHGEEIKTLDLDSGKTMSLGTKTTSRVAVAPGGERIAYVTTSGDLVVRTLATGEETGLAAASRTATLPAFSFDGSLVAFDMGGLIYATAANGLGVLDILQSGAEVSWSP